MVPYDLVGDAAKNESGSMGSFIGAGAGLGMGFAMPGIIQQSMSSLDSKNHNNESTIDKIKKLKELLDMKAISKEEYESKKDHLMNKI